MEQKRILWVVASVGLFLLVVIGSALFLYSPKPTTDNALTSLESTGKAWVKGNVALSNIEPQNIAENSVNATSTGANNLLTNADTTGVASTLDNSTIHADNLTVYANNTNVYPQNQLAGNAENNGKTVINLNVKEEPDVSKVDAKTEPAKTGTTSNQSTKTATATSKTTTTNKNSSTSTKSTVAKTQPAKTDKIPDQWWVQVASPTNKQSAEDVRAMLSAQKINSEVFTYNDSNNVLHYRVRVGPYTTEGEAAYWCKIVKETGNFKDAYTSNSSAKKS